MLVGLKSPALLSVYGAGDSLIATYTIPSASSEERQWVGVVEDGRDMFSVVLAPQSRGSYAIDDVETGSRSPEPASALMWMIGAIMLGRRSRASSSC